jgi:phage/plasmid primase-like uncharacterized protein
VRIEDELARRGVKLKRVAGELIGPCPVCGGTDRFAISIVKRVWNCRICAKGGDIITLVQHLDGCDFVTAIETLTGEEVRTQIEAIPEREHHNHDNDGRIARALQYWREAGPIEGTVATTYLERDRQITALPPAVHDVLRFHRRVVFGHDNAGNWTHHGCILALYRDVITNEPTGIHRIALGHDGGLVGRMGLGRKQGSAIKFWNDTEVTTGLVVGEGIETVVAAAMHVEHRGTLLQPAWSLIDAGNLARFPIVPGIEHLTVLADADANNAGQEAARTCAKRYAEARREAVVLIPDRLGGGLQRYRPQVAETAGAG